MNLTEDEDEEEEEEDEEKEQFCQIEASCFGALSALSAVVVGMSRFYSAFPKTKLRLGRKGWRIYHSEGQSVLQQSSPLETQFVQGTLWKGWNIIRS